ncbi:RHS repeat protein [Salmonella enterica]|nr:RHS repeat protein [Salmonella enterica]
MSTSLFSKTPSVTVLDNRGLTVCDIAYHRHPESPDVTSERITRHQYDARGFLTQSADPRLHDAGVANFTYLTDLAGNVLRSQGVDNGITVVLNDAAGRPFIAVSNISTAGDGTQDSSQAVTRTLLYEDATLPGRPLSIMEQVPGETARITERFVYAGNGKAEKALNLAGQCVGHYDTAGLMQTDRVALTGAPLSVTRRLLKDADNPDTVADWQGADALAWNDLLDREAYTTLTTADVTGAVLTTTDAKGNLLRVTYDVAGLLSGSWLTLKDGTEQAIVKSLTYSAAGQKLREEHGNGVVTTYEYEPQTQRLVGIKTERPAGHTAGAKVLQDLRYEYDPVGNVLKISNDAEETRFWRNQKVVPENRYTCDSLYQLVSATGREMANAGQQGSNLPSATIPLPADSSAYTNYTRTYTYDSAGNLTQISHSAPATGNNYTTDITVSDRSNRGVLSTLTENPSGVDALFTAGGQQKQLQPGQNLVWTPRNELLQVTPVRREGDTGDRESYSYDTDSQRLQKVSVQKTKTSTQTQRVVYLPGLELRTTSNGKNETERLQVITVGETGRAQVRVLHWQGETPEGISNDQLRYSYDNLAGSSQLELNGKGEVITVEEYYPYGGTAVWTACSAMEAAYKTIRYSGKERDATGLYYYGYRYYLPWAGRWLSADPAGTIDGMNLFRMVRNNPVTLRDALGMDTEQDAAIKIQSAFRGYLSRKAVSVKNIHGVIHTHISSSGHITLPENTRGREVQSRLRIGASYDSLLVQGGAGNFDVYHKPDNAPVMNTTSLLELNNVSGTKAFLNGGFFANNESLIMPSGEVTGEKFKGHIIGPAPERHNKVEIPIQWRKDYAVLVKNDVELLASGPRLSGESINFTSDLYLYEGERFSSHPGGVNPLSKLQGNLAHSGNPNPRAALSLSSSGDIRMHTLSTDDYSRDKGGTMTEWRDIVNAMAPGADSVNMDGGASMSMGIIINGNIMQITKGGAELRCIANMVTSGVMKNQVPHNLRLKPW